MDEVAEVANHPPLVDEVAEVANHPPLVDEVVEAADSPPLAAAAAALSLAAAERKQEAKVANREPRQPAPMIHKTVGHKPGQMTLRPNNNYLQQEEMEVVAHPQRLLLRIQLPNREVKARMRMPMRAMHPRLSSSSSRTRRPRIRMVRSSSHRSSSRLHHKLIIH